MKTYILFFLLAFSFIFISCNDNDETPVNTTQDETLVGKWKMYEQYISPGGPASWETVDNGYEVTFNTDLSFTNFANCMAGNYIITDDILSIDCTTSDVGVNTDFDYTIEFESNDVLVLSNRACIEPCMDRLRRIE